MRVDVSDWTCQTESNTDPGPCDRWIVQWSWRNLWAKVWDVAYQYRLWRHSLNGSRPTNLGRVVHVIECITPQQELPLGQHWGDLKWDLEGVIFVIAEAGYVQKDWIFKPVILTLFNRVCHCGIEKLSGLEDSKLLQWMFLLLWAVWVEPSLLSFRLGGDGFESLKHQ